jgi:enhancing lycopene biosynthesis protein 2
MTRPLLLLLLLLLCHCRANFESLLGPLLPQLEAAAKNYSGYRPNKQGVQVRPNNGFRLYAACIHTAVAPIYNCCIAAMLLPDLVINQGRAGEANCTLH